MSVYDFELEENIFFIINISIPAEIKNTPILTSVIEIFYLHSHHDPLLITFAEANVFQTSIYILYLTMLL